MKDSDAPDTKSPSSASGTPGDAASSPPVSPAFPSSRTFVKSQKAHGPEDCERWEEAERTGTLTERDGTAPSTLVVPFVQNQRDELREISEAQALAGPGTHQTNYLAFIGGGSPKTRSIGASSEATPTLNSRGNGSTRTPLIASLPTDSRIAEEIAPTLHAQKSEARGGSSGPLIFEGRLARNGRGAPEETCPPLKSQSGSTGKGDAAPMLLTSSPEDSPARTSPSPASAPGSPASAPPSSSSSPASQESLFAPEDTFSLRTSRVFSVLTADGTSLPSSGRWPTSGFTTSPGVFLTPNSSEYPSGGGASSSLPDVLEGRVARKYFLSPKAAAGILRRAAKRGKLLPPHLEAALRAVISQAPSAAPAEADPETTPTA